MLINNNQYLNQGYSHSNTQNTEPKYEIPKLKGSEAQNDEYKIEKKPEISWLPPKLNFIFYKLANDMGIDEAQKNNIKVELINEVKTNPDLKFSLEELDLNDIQTKETLLKLMQKQNLTTLDTQNTTQNQISENFYKKLYDIISLGNYRPISLSI